MINPRKTIIDNTISRVTAATGVTIEEIRAKNRHMAIVYARNILCHELAEQRFRNGEIGEVIHRDRSTIYNCIQMYRNDYATDQAFRELAQQAERERSQRERRLPDNLPVRHSEPPITEKQKEMTALAYLLADVIYQIMFDLCEQMQSGGTDLRHESKYRFNELFKAAQNFRDRASRVSRDVAVMKSDRAFDDFFEDSEWLRETIELLFNRALATEDAKVRIQALLFNLPQR